MKWKNKGHEFDMYAEQLIENKGLPEKYYIFGAGFLGKTLLSVLRVYGYEIFFIDNNPDKQGKKIDGVNIISLEDYLKVRDGQIVVSVAAENSEAIVSQLEKNFLKWKCDFWLYDEFVNYIFPIISTYYHEKSFVSLAQISLTERCTLKCKKCAHGCFAVSNNTAVDLTLNQVYKGADSFFAKVDFIKEFVLIGGEPLLYKDLAQVVKYIGEHYRNRIGIFSITTNGTIIPDEETLQVCQKYKVLLRISNYSGQIPRLKQRYKELKKVLEEKGISYFWGKEEVEWMDYGFEHVDRKGEALEKVFDSCKTPCREIRENRFYYCVMARSVSDNLGFHVGNEDFLDLDDLDGKGYKKELLEFTLGYSEKGYLDMCNYCNGAEASRYPVPAAEQMDREYYG
ncbi:MAG: 4Fe-4S cluster-binding domain-containing protein [Lachnospiraceae bacterium]